MVLNDLTILEYLHDAAVSEVVYDAKDTNGRHITLSVKCDRDAGYPPWDGKRLRIRLESIVVLFFSAFGAVAGKERINSWGTIISPPLEAEVRRLQGLGVDCSGIRFAVTFQSGSILEGLCQCIVAEHPPATGEE